MTLDQWQAIGIVCGAAIALITLLDLLRRKVIMPTWRVIKKAAALVDDLVGDEDAGEDGIMKQVQSIRARLDDHLRWHGRPGGRPAARPPGPGPGPNSNAHARDQRRV